MSAVALLVRFTTAHRTFERCLENQPYHVYKPKGMYTYKQVVYLRDALTASVNNALLQAEAQDSNFLDKVPDDIRQYLVDNDFLPR